jgi:hypothetical protein
MQITVIVILDGRRWICRPVQIKSSKQILRRVYVGF